MAQKIRFELNIDEIIECKQFPSNDNVIFFGEQATGKTFLFVDKLTGDKQAIVCIEPASENRTYAHVNYFTVPSNAVIIDDDAKQDTTHEALMSHIQDCCDKVCQTIQTNADIADSKHSVILQSLRPVLEKIEEGGTGNGISEKTLLEALKIVSKQTE